MSNQAEVFYYGDGINLQDHPTDEVSESRRLFGKDLHNDDELLDSFATQLGVKPRKAEVEDIVFKSVQLLPGENDEDRVLLYELMNDKELYPVLEVDPTWTPRGQFHMFIIYGESTKVKKKRQEAAKLASTP
jgi:hypothetical protein